MNLRCTAAAAGVALLFAGCANDSQTAVFGYQAGAPLVGTAQAAESQPTDAQLARKTLAGKVLTAIALERVTGRKPDPSRFSELD